MFTPEMKQAIKTLSAIGLVNTSSALQLKNGTLEFMDPLKKTPSGMATKYTLHANGYYRKYNYNRWSKRYDGYQLNRIKKAPYTSRYGTCTINVRVLIPGQYEVMAARIVSIAVNSRMLYYR
jgi:hypothetical protein